MPGKRGLRQNSLCTYDIIIPQTGSKVQMKSCADIFYVDWKFFRHFLSDKTYYEKRSKPCGGQCCPSHGSGHSKNRIEKIYGYAHRQGCICICTNKLANLQPERISSASFPREPPVYPVSRNKLSKPQV